MRKVNTINTHLVRRRMKGTSLMEVLVTVIVLSVGLLGLAGLQLTGLRANTTAEARSMATLLAYDMADRMRANLAGVTSGAYNSIDGTETNPGCITTGCSTAQLAQYDAWQWNELIDNTTALPSGVGQVTGNGSIFTVTVMWDQARLGATGTDCGSDESVDLKCLSIEVRP